MLDHEDDSEGLSESQLYASNALQALRDGAADRKEAQGQQIDPSMPSQAEALMCYESLGSGGPNDSHRLTTGGAIMTPTWPPTATVPGQMQRQHEAAYVPPQAATCQGPPSPATAQGRSPGSSNQRASAWDRNRLSGPKDAAGQHKSPAKRGNGFGKQQPAKGPGKVQEGRTKKKKQKPPPVIKPRTRPVQLAVMLHPHSGDSANQFFPGNSSFPCVLT